MNKSAKVTTKPWGRSIRRYIDSTVQIEEAHIVKGGYSSIHRHEHKVNVFVMLSGVLEVKLFSDAKSLLKIDSAMLKAERAHDNEYVRVLPGVWHQFYAHEPTVVREIYLLEGPGKIAPDDIERASDNGVDETIADSAPLDMQFVSAGMEFCALCSGCISPGEHRHVITIQGAERTVCDRCTEVADSLRG